MVQVTGQFGLCFGAEGALQLLPRLLQQLLAVGQHQHRATGQPGQMREDDGLPRACRQADEHPADARPPRGQDRLDRLALVRAQHHLRGGRRRS